MIKKRIAFVACLLPISLSISAADGNLKGVDVRQFKVAGVSVGMDMGQAVDAVTRHFKVERKSLRIDAPKGYPVAEFKENLILYVNGGERLAVTLAPRVPIDNNRPQVVTSVSYSLGNTPENKTAMIEGAKARYGQPNRAIGLNLEWCLTPTAPQGLGVMCELDKNQATLELNTVFLTLKLEDRSWNAAIADHLKKPVKPTSGF